MSKTVNRSPQFYFSLLRFLAMLRRGDARRAESNAVEAWLVGLLVYLIHYLFFATQLFPPGLVAWLAALFFILLAFWVWLFWLLLLYINSVIIKLLRSCGFSPAIPTRRAQSILWGMVTTAMACALLTRGPWVHELGAIWLVAVAMNLAAAVLLALRSEPKIPT